MLDCVIEGGLLVDGTARPAVQADVGIRDGRVVAIGRQEESARRTIDAEGMVVAPGFIDPHTHYDAQVMWDASLSPSALHGVTTVIGGNCGFTIAPVTGDSAEYIMGMLARVEGMPVESLEAVLDFRWNSFAEWLTRFDGSIAVNAGFLVGHSTIRKTAMGDAWQDAPTDQQLARMAEMVDDSVRGGAMGFSSSWEQGQGDHLGNPVPSRFAEVDELAMLASVLRSHPGTTLEFIPPNTGTTEHWPESAVHAMIEMSASAQSALNWNVLLVRESAALDVNAARLAVSDRAAAEGAEIVALSLPLPLQFRVNLLSTIAYNSMPTWQHALSLPVPDRMRALADANTRARLVADVEEFQRHNPMVHVQFDRITVESVETPASKDLEGRVIGDIARERGVSPVDALLDIAVASNLNVCFQSPPDGDDEASWQQRAEYWQDPRVLVGASDAGAHLDMASAFAYFTDFVGPTVRDRQLLRLEDAVQKVTDAPARLYGLRDRGRIAPGYRADVVVFDPETVRTGDFEMRGDMPRGGYRLFADAVGVEHVLVNGVEIVERGKFTGATPGTVIRPGRDTEDRKLRTPSSKVEEERQAASA